MKRCHLIAMGIITLVLLIACADDTAPEAGSDTSTGSDQGCELTVLFLFDASGSMGNDLGDGSTVMGVLKESFAGLSTVILEDPLNKWNIGLLTFEENSTLLLWGFDILTNWNSMSLEDAIAGLIPAGGSDMQAALGYAGILLSEQPQPRFLIIFTDGEICGQMYATNTCDPFEAFANLLKNYGTKIITISYDLQAGTNPDDIYIDVLTNMASSPTSGEDTEPWFFNLDGPSAIESIFNTTIGDLCELLDVGFRAGPPTLRAAPGSNPSFDYEVFYISGDPYTIRLMSEGSLINSGGAVVFSTGSVGSIGQANPILAGKGDMTIPASLSAGQYDARLNVMLDGTNLVLATRTISIDVVPFDIELSFIQQPQYLTDSELISARVRVSLTEGGEEEISLHSEIRDATGARADGFTLLAQVSSHETISSSSDIRHRIQYKREKENGDFIAQAGSYKIEYIVYGYSISTHQYIIESSEVLIP